MEIELSGERDESVARAVRLAVDAAGLGEVEGPHRVNAWWRAGLREALARGALEPTVPRYGAMRPPRNTRGATRA